MGCLAGSGSSVECCAGADSVGLMDGPPVVTGTGSPRPSVSPASKALAAKAGLSDRTLAVVVVC
jgi:hypothetical protein